MNTAVRQEEPAFVLSGGSRWATETSEVRVSYRELQQASIGTVWTAINPSGCVRAEYEAEATLVFRDQHGAAVVFRYYRTGDKDYFEELEPTVELVWFEFQSQQ